MTLLQEVKEKFSIIGKNWDTAIFEIQGRQVTISKENFIDIAKDTDLSSDPFIAYDLKFVFSSDSSVLYRRKFSSKWFFNVPNRYEIEVKKLSSGDESTILELNDEDKNIKVIEERQDNEDLFDSENEIDILRERVLDLENQINILNQRITDLQNDNDSLRSNLEYFQTENNLYKNTIVPNLNSQIEELTRKLTDNEYITELKNQIRNLQNQLEEKIGIIDTKNKEIENLNNTILQLRQEIENDNDEETISNLRIRLRYLENVVATNERLLNENETLKEDVKSLTDQVYNLNTKISDLEKEISDLKRKINKLEFENENLQEQVNTLNDNYMKSLLADAYNLMTEVQGMINNTNFDNAVFNMYKNNYKNFTAGFVEHDEIEKITFDENNLKLLRQKIAEFIRKYEKEELTERD